MSSQNASLRTWSAALGRSAARTEPRLRPVVVMRMTMVSNGIDTGMWTQFAK